MTDQRVGAAFRAIRIKRRWRQSDVATRAGIARSQVSLIERGHLDALTLRALRTVSLVLDIRVDVVARWRGGELDRLLNARHSALENAVTEWLRGLGWQVLPEVSFSIGRESGWIDLLAWHAATQTLLVIEIKTEIVDVQQLIGLVDRKARLAPRLARDRGWTVRTIASLVVVADGPTNRRRVSAHSSLLKTAFPSDGRTARRWLKSPVGRFRGLVFFSSGAGRDGKPAFATQKRVRVASARAV